MPKLSSDVHVLAKLKCPPEPPFAVSVCFPTSSRRGLALLERQKLFAGNLRELASNPQEIAASSLSAIPSTRSSPYHRKPSHERRRYRCLRRTDTSSTRVHYGRRHQNHRRFSRLGDPITFGFGKGRADRQSSTWTLGIARPCRLLTLRHHSTIAARNKRRTDRRARLCIAPLRP
jgi:hypothetical protein